MIILGVSTWGDDEIEFQEDFDPIFQKMVGADIKGKRSPPSAAEIPATSFSAERLTCLKRKSTNWGQASFMRH